MMSPTSFDTGIIFLIQTVLGIIGNSSLLCLYTFTVLSGHLLKPIDLILSQLVLANSVVLFSKGIPQTMITLGWNYFLDDTRCKLVFYFYRVGTGASFTIVCLFNGFQAIKLNPRICRCTWIQLKIRSLKFIGGCCLLIWFLHFLMNSFLPVIVDGPLNERNLSIETNHGSCSWKMPEHASIYTLLYFFPDMMTLVFMIWASGLVILVLHRHKQRVQHTHSSSLSSGASNEDRATCRIVTLVIFFATFYSVYLSLTLQMVLAENSSKWRVNSSVLLASCFPTISPYVLIISDTRISQVCFTCKAKDKAFH
uniref:Vomeronasal type-1 receptor n=1 Tax=Nannospalax galili TaxID=1026970 RepID=A0A4Y1N712_NANGA|nr:vomeronasal type 1 receptor 14 [Nannospalax galili]AWV49927.1 vomeronasal type 1 receptor 14 [Nannospalax galili]AWV49931.1 vomeronasal type 1 receptor 14 [Nannospalax galili]AWV49945.1 vomeronasal type 1 receptor 14 [Nannospalax galili]AWV49949.1 vomeronasal type 1 receptor 14 [Nannospalax galili]